MVLLQAAAVASSAHAESRNVALIPFTTDENTWESMTAAADLAAKIQADLASEPGINWVEREEIGPALRELELGAALGEADLPQRIRRARWSNADWLVTGHIEKSDSGREVLLEVINATHADILAKDRLPVPSGPLREVVADTRAVADLIRECLEAARNHEREVAGMPTVAVLIFPDSDVFQQDFVSAIEDPAVVGVKCRVLRIPRAGKTIDEASLLVDGFSEDANGSWHSIAAIYVWGSLALRATGSIDGETIFDAHTPKITLNVWDGAHSPLRFVEEGTPVNRRDYDEAVAEQARRLARNLKQLVERRSNAAANASERQRLSRALLGAAEELEGSKTHRAGYLHEPEGRKHFFNLLQTLEAACFFDPQNRSAREALVRTRWNRRLENVVKNRFRFQLGRSAAWGSYVERFGLPARDEVAMQGQRNEEQVQPLIAKALRRGWPVAREYLSSSCEAASAAALGNREQFGYPQGIPDGVAKDWSEELRLDLARRTLATVGRDDVDVTRALRLVMDSRGPGFFYVRDPRKRVELLQKVWPALTEQVKSRVVHHRWDELREDIEWTFEELGMAGAEKALFSSVQPASTNPPSEAPQAAGASHAVDVKPSPAAVPFRLPPITALPVEVKPNLETFHAPAEAGLFRILDMALLAGKVWIMGEGLESTEVTGNDSSLSTDLTPTKYQARRLFSFDPETRKIIRVEATKQFTPVDIQAHDGKLWLTFGKDGAAMLDPETGGLRRFGSEDNLDVTSAYHLAVAGDRIFLTADGQDLFLWDSAANRWEEWSAEFPKPEPPLYGYDSRRIAGLGSYVLLCKGAVGLRKIDGREWTRFDDDLISRVPGRQFYYLEHRAGGARYERMDIRSVSATETGFWLGDDAGLHFINPNTGETRSHLRPLNSALSSRAAVSLHVSDFLLRRAACDAYRTGPGEGNHPLRPASRIPGKVVALAPDGEFLWVATEHADPDAGGSCLLLFHTPSKRWVAHARVSRIAALAVDERYLWMGNFLSYGPGSRCLRRIEKQSLMAVPPGQWMSDTISDAELSDAFGRFDSRERALWKFADGDYTAAADLLETLDPTPETLFLLGLCYDRHGLDQPERSRSHFQRIAEHFPDSPLADDAKKLLRRVPTEY